MEEFIEILRNVFFDISCVGLIACGIAMFLFKALPNVWETFCKAFGRNKISRSVFILFSVGAIMYGGTKNDGPTGVSKFIFDKYISDNGSYSTNDTVVIKWKQTIENALPIDTPVYIEYKLAGSTNDWEALASSAQNLGNYEWNGSLVGATNYNYNIYCYYIPPAPVHTNGVWTYNTLKDTQNKNILPLRAEVRDGGEVIATPKSKGPAALLGYASRGLVCFYDESDPDGETCDTSFLLKAEGNSSYEEVYTCEFCVTKLTNSEWVNVTWNNGSYPFLARPTYQTYLPNAYQTGARGEEVRGLYFTTNLVLTVSAVPDGNGKRSFYWLGKYAASCSQNMSATLAKAIYPKKLNIHNSTDIVIHSYRLYNRQLTAEEVAHNYEIDKARFGSGNE